MQTVLPGKRRFPLPGEGAGDGAIDRANAHTISSKWTARSYIGDSPKGLLELDPTHMCGMVSAQTIKDNRKHTGGSPQEVKVLPKGRIPICDSPMVLFELDPTHAHVAVSAQTA